MDSRIYEKVQEAFEKGTFCQRLFLCCILMKSNCMNIFAPGGRVLIRDKEWLVRRVDNSNDGGLLLSCEGVNERKKNRVFHCGGRATARYRNVLFNLNRITAKLKGEKMQTIVINVNNDVLADKVRWLLEHFQNEGLEIVSKEDAYDLKLLRATRNEESVPFDEYLKHENLYP